MTQDIQLVLSIITIAKQKDIQLSWTTKMKKINKKNLLQCCYNTLTSHGGLDAF